VPPKRSSETHAYGWIKRELKRRGFNTHNPNRDPHGEVYTQHECQGHDELKRGLGGEIPENMVRLGARSFWVIEAKAKPSELPKAFREAKGYGDKVNGNTQEIRVVLASGVAGSDEDGYRAKTAYLKSGKWEEVTLEGNPLRRLPKKEECTRIQSQDTAQIAKRELTTREIVDLSNRINRKLHGAKVTKEKRAPTVAVLLCALSKSPGLRLTDSADVFVSDINSRAEAIFLASEKKHLWSQIKLVAPSEDNKAYAGALDEVILELHRAEIVSASPDSDVLGSFFENFLRYGNTSKDLGIVLTPRHICRFVAEIMDVEDTDMVYDPALGTGGFLIAAFNHVRSKRTQADANRFAKNRIYGCDEYGPVASLAFANMYFRGDGKHNLRNASCFGGHLSASSSSARRARFRDGKEFKSREKRVSTKVMMNPPFAQNENDEYEYRFVDHALDQLQDKGLLFTVLPSSVMYAHEFAWWRTELLEDNQLVTVVLFPNDLFYPVAVESVGVFLRKGVPHSDNVVLWIRLDDDGFTKWKGFRIEKHGQDHRQVLNPIIEVARNWCLRGVHAADKPGLFEFRTIRGDELVPQSQMGTPPLVQTDFTAEVGRAIRDHIYSRWRIAAEVQHGD